MFKKIFATDFSEDLKKIVVLSAILGTIMVVPTFLVFNMALAVNPGDVVINEFSSNSSPEWVELLNMSDNDISLSGFKLSELTIPQGIPTEILLLNLSGTIPAHGILVFDVSGLNNNGDSIALYNEEIHPDNLWQRVTYGTVTGYPITAGLETGPKAGESAYLASAPSTWDIDTTPSKGWFNDAGEPAPVETDRENVV